MPYSYARETLAVEREKPWNFSTGGLIQRRQGRSLHLEDVSISASRTRPLFTREKVSMKVRDEHRSSLRSVIIIVQSFWISLVKRYTSKTCAKLAYVYGKQKHLWTRSHLFPYPTLHRYSFPFRTSAVHSSARRAKNRSH